MKSRNLNVSISDIQIWLENFQCDKYSGTSQISFSWAVTSETSREEKYVSDRFIQPEELIHLPFNQNCSVSCF